MRLSGQPALKARLAASSKRDGDEWTWILNAAPAASAVWDERTCEVAGDAAQIDLRSKWRAALQGSKLTSNGSKVTTSNGLRFLSLAVGPSGFSPVSPTRELDARAATQSFTTFRSHYFDFRFSSWWCQKSVSRVASPSVQVNLNHCARFIFSLALSTKPKYRVFPLPLAPAEKYGSREECDCSETRSQCVSAWVNLGLFPLATFWAFSPALPVRPLS